MCKRCWMRLTGTGCGKPARNGPETLRPYPTLLESSATAEETAPLLTSATALRLIEIGTEPAVPESPISKSGNVLAPASPVAPVGIEIGTPDLNTARGRLPPLRVAAWRNTILQVELQTVVLWGSRANGKGCISQA